MSVGRGGRAGDRHETTVVSLGPTRHKLSRFPSTLEIFAAGPKTLLFNCLILGTAGHPWSMDQFPMPKYLADNRIIVAIFMLLTLVNAFAIQNQWYA